MLLRFSVKNYLGIQKERGLNLASTRSRKLQKTNTFPSKSSSFKSNVLRSVLIYGANFSGKSNFLDALRAMQEIVVCANELSKECLNANIVPFVKDKSSPSEFSIVFYYNNFLYEYGFVATKTRILEEWVFIIQEDNSDSSILQRRYCEKTDSYSWEGNLDYLRKEELTELQSSTLESSSFVSIATSLNIEVLSFIRDWFKNELLIKLSRNSYKETLQLCNTYEGKQKVINALNAIDCDITDINFTSIESNPLVNLTYTTGLQVSLEKDAKGAHLFYIIGCLITALEEGKVICIDDFGEGLHPSVSSFLLSWFHNSLINKNNSQLICTTSNMSFLDEEVIRKDQVWLMEKSFGDNKGALYSVSDFKPKKGKSLSLSTTYLRGCFGGVPYIKRSYLV